jgi:phytoene synthase
MQTEAASLRQEDLARCRDILRVGSKSFYVAAALLPGRVRAPVTALYAFCRVADEAVDGPDATPDAVDRLRVRLDGAYTGHPDDHPVDRSLSRVVREYAIPREVLDAMLEGFVWDLSGYEYRTISDVYAYSARVGATVGVMVSAIMGARSATALARASDLGVAMQMTNIARDVGEDARRGRLYLPADWMVEAGIDPDSWLADASFSPELAAVVRRLLEDAGRLYSRARAGIPLVPSDCRLAITSALLIYADIGREIERAGYDSVSRRAYTSRTRKAVLVARALRRGRGAPAATDEPTVPEARFLVEAFGRPSA